MDNDKSGKKEATLSQSACCLELEAPPGVLALRALYGSRGIYIGSPLPQSPVFQISA